MKLSYIISFCKNCDFYFVDKNRHYLITQNDFDELEKLDLEICMILPQLSIQQAVDRREIKCNMECRVYLKKVEEKNEI